MGGALDRVGAGGGVRGALANIETDDRRSDNFEVVLLNHSADWPFGQPAN